MAIINMADIRKVYDTGKVKVEALKGVDLEIGKGEMVAIVGPSGSGKSTLMNLIGCLDTPTSGAYELGGQTVAGVTRDTLAEIRNKRVGFVFQNFNLLPRTSALEQVMMPLTYSLGDLPEREGRQRAEQLLERVGLADRMHHEPSQLSGGQQQRVAIARALINNPPLLFADEPTGNLDSHTSVEVLEMFEKLNREQGITIILVTHDPNVANHARRRIHIHDGKIESGAFNAGSSGLAAEATA